MGLEDLGGAEPYESSLAWPGLDWAVPVSPLWTGLAWAAPVSPLWPGLRPSLHTWRRSPRSLVPAWGSGSALNVGSMFTAKTYQLLG